VRNRFLTFGIFSFICALALSLTNCGGGGSSPAPPPANNPVPNLTSISPTSATAGGAAFSLTVTGTNFVSNSVVRWNGADRSTPFQSSTQLTASITAADIASTGTAQVTVFNPTPGGGTSGAVAFNITSASALSIGTTRLPDGGSGKLYDVTVAVSGGVPPYAWSLSSGTLPGGLTLDGPTGRISGTLATVGSDTTASFTVQVSDSAAQPHTGTQSLSILVHVGSLGRNNTCSAATATKISNGVTRASISPYGDVDVYSFEGTAGSKVTIEIYAQRLDIYGDGVSDRDVYLDSFLEILNSSCSQIAFNDDIDPGVMQDSLIQDYVLPAPGGTYYIRVSDLRGDGRPDFIYDLHLSGAN
jgi:hypothetical protein